MATIRYITYEQAAQIPAFQGKTAAQVAGLVADATLLWRYVQGQPWATDDDLAAYATSQGLDTDRRNAGLALLRQTQRIFGFEDTPIVQPPVPAPLAVAAQLPLAGATGVAVSTQVWAQFTQALDASTVGANTLVVASPAGAVAGAVAYVPARLQVVFTPTEPLQPGTAYSATLAGTVANGSGVQLGNDVSWDFTTAG